MTIKIKADKFLSRIIILNRRIKHEYSILDEFEAGLVLLGWEVKSLRTGKVDIKNSYVIIKKNECFLFGAHFSILPDMSFHDSCNSRRTIKLLLSQRELKLLQNYINRNRYTAVVLSLYWKKAWCKAKIGIAKGKTQYDKRLECKERTWNLDKIRIIKNSRQ